MPLPSPFAYIVSYNLKNHPYTYLPLMEELQRSHKWWHFIESAWLVLRYESLAELQSKLVPLVFTTDQLLIMPAKGPAVGWLPPDAWGWIRENVPREW